LASSDSEKRRELAAGPAAAAAIGLACGLASLTARLAGVEAVAGRAQTLRARAEALGREDEAAYAAVLAGGGEAARERTVDLPLRMAELAAEAAELAAEAAAAHGGSARYDAVAGALLAEAAARIACLLVEVNLAGRGEDGRLQRARQASARAARAAEHAGWERRPGSRLSAR
jgi:formiminotetrahydrofolate cyclodeaminase